MASPFGPCCCGESESDCCHCDAAPSQYIIDFGAGVGFTNGRCNNCTALTGEYILTRPEDSQGCLWLYDEADFCSDSETNCSDNYRLQISFESTFWGSMPLTCEFKVWVRLRCNENCTDTDPPCDTPKGDFDALWHDFGILATDIECFTADFPYTLPSSFRSGTACGGSPIGSIDIKEP